ncbi:MFS transporter [Pistricoccus aurantiacus]|nr:MFS transporter [Pistricoccus aurantiacus]
MSLEASARSGPHTTPRRLGLFLLVMVLVGLNLRPALSSLSPLLIRVQEDTGLGAAGVGALTTLPVLCLGLFAPLAPWLSHRLGSERALSIGLLLLTVALILRANHSLLLLFLGTLMAGAAIGICGTLLPGLVKRELPQNADLMTGVYTMALCLGGALGAILSVPLADWLNSWTASLMSWSLLALIALFAWRGLMPHPWPEPASSSSRNRPKVRLTRNALAWQVTVLMGSQSSLAYIVFGWLPTLLQRRGIDEAEAGWMLGISVMAQLASAFAAPWLARLGRDQRPALLLLLATNGAGLLLLLLGPLSLRWWGVVILGLGQGGCFSLALTLLVLRSGSAFLAGQLSGMAQGFGYCLAALGPLGVGVLLQFGASLNVISLMLMGIVTVSMSMAWLSGRRRQLELDEYGVLTTRRHS